MKISELGQLVFTTTLYDSITANPYFKSFVTQCLGRFTQHDWGILTDSDREQNDNAVKAGEGRIHGVYPFPDGCKWNAVNHYKQPETAIWIITESDRSVTTILFPGEY